MYTIFCNTYFKHIYTIPLCLKSDKDNVHIRGLHRWSRLFVAVYQQWPSNLGLFTAGLDGVGYWRQDGGYCHLGISLLRWDLASPSPLCRLSNPYDISYDRIPYRSSLRSSWLQRGPVFSLIFLVDTACRDDECVMYLFTIKK